MPGFARPRLSCRTLLSLPLSLWDDPAARVAQALAYRSPWLARHCRRKRLPARATRQSRARFILPRTGRIVGVPGWQHRRSLAAEAPRSTRWVGGSMPSSGSLFGAACLADRHCRRKRLPARATRQSRARFILPRTGRIVGVPGWQHRRSLATEAPLAPRSVPGGDGGPTQAPVPLTEQRARLAGTAVGSVYPPVQPGRAGPASYCHGRGELSACPVGSTAVIEPPRPRGPLDLPGGLWGSTHSSGSLFGAACLAGRHCRRKRLPARATRQSRARFILPRTGRFVGVPGWQHRRSLAAEAPRGPRSTRWVGGFHAQLRFPRRSSVPGWQALPSEAFTRPCNPAEPGPLHTATDGTICRRARLAAPPFTSHRGPAGPSIGTRWGWGSDPSSGSLDGAACPAGRHCRRKRLPARATRQSRARFLLPRAGRFAVGSVYPPVQPDRAGPASYCHGRDDLSACPVGSTAVHQPPRPRWPLDRYPVGMGVRPKLRFP